MLKFLASVSQRARYVRLCLGHTYDVYFRISHRKSATAKRLIGFSDLHNPVNQTGFEGRRKK